MMKVSNFVNSPRIGLAGASAPVFDEMNGGDWVTVTEPPC